MSARCTRHPDGPRYTRPNSSKSECVPCRRERGRVATDPARWGRSRPGVLAGREDDVLLAVESGLWTAREVAAAFGVSEGRVSQLRREAREGK